MVLLEVRKVKKTFGGLVVLDNVEMNIQKGEILGMIGPNGAGKSTLFNIIIGVHKPTVGSVIFENIDITGFPPNEVAKRGVIKTYQANVLFKSLSVAENILVGHHLQVRANPIGVFLSSSKYRRDIVNIQNSTQRIMKLFGLSEREKELAGDLPHGYQRILGMATATAGNPKLLLLDEPVTGMNAAEVSLTIEIIRGLRESGITIMIVEHNIKVVMNLCERIIVLSLGRKIAEGPPEAIKENKDVIEAYLGVE